MKSQQNLKQGIFTFFTFFEMPLQKKRKVTFFGFSKKNVKYVFSNYDYITVEGHYRRSLRK